MLMVAGLLLAAAASARAQAPATDLKKLEGTWVGGVKQPGGKGKSGAGTMVAISELTIKNGVVVSCKDAKGVSLGTNQKLTLNPQAKTLDATGSTRNHNGLFQGIFKVNGDTLEWCVANPGKARPDGYYTVPQVQFHMALKKKP